MAFLVVGSETVGASVNNAGGRTKEYSRDINRAVDNSLLVTTTGTTKREWSLSTIPMTPANAATLETQIETVPVTCSGDLLGGSVSCVGTVTDRVPGPIPGDHQVILEFTLREV